MRSFLTAIIVLAPVYCSTAPAQVLKNNIDCSRFSKQPNGEWCGNQSNLEVGNQRMTPFIGCMGQNAMLLKDGKTDLWTLIETKCGQK